MNYWFLVYEMRQSLALVKQLTRIGHVWRIIIGQSTLATSRLVIYNKYIVDENE